MIAFDEFGWKDDFSDSTKIRHLMRKLKTGRIHVKEKEENEEKEKEKEEEEDDDDLADFASS